LVLARGAPERDGRAAARWARTLSPASVRRSTHRGPRPLHRTASPAPSSRRTCRALRGHATPTLRRPANRKPTVRVARSAPMPCPRRDYCGFRARQVVDHYKKPEFPPCACTLPVAVSVHHHPPVRPRRASPSGPRRCQPKLLLSALGPVGASTLACCLGSTAGSPE
jgi:hypothetical protein